MPEFHLQAPFEPTGDQPQAIARLVEGVRRGYRHQVLLGATGTGKSVAGDVPVWLWVDEGQGEQVVVVPIGPYLDRLFDEHPEAVLRHEEHEILPANTLSGRWRTFAFSPATRRVGLFPVLAFVRHRVREPLYRVTTRCGRQITVTGGHNFWVLRRGQWVLTTTEDLRPGEDHLPLPTRLPSPAQPLCTLDLLPYLEDTPLFVEAPDTIERFLSHSSPYILKQMLEKVGIAQGWSKISAMRTGKRGRGVRVAQWLALLQRYPEFAAVWSPKHATVGGKKAYHRLPVQYPLNADFMRLLGYFLAEGHATSRAVLLSVRSPSLAADLERILRSLYMKWSKRPSGDFQISSSVLSALFCKWMGARATHKRLPPFWPSLSQEHLAALLSAYFDGDGAVERASAVTAVTASPSLAADLQAALLRFGIWARIRPIRKRATNTDHPGSIYMQVTISGQENLQHFARAIGFRSPHKQAALEALLQKKGNSNVDVVPIAGEDLQALRARLGWTRYQVAAYTGLPVGTLRAWERGWRRPQRRALQAYLKVLQTRAPALAAQETWQHLTFLTHFFWTPIASVERIEPDTGWVYDLSVAEAETFLAGWGGLWVHNTFTVASIIAQLQMPALVLAHNKTLAAQLYAEFQAFFPDNAVEYFVSYYDYYQPEAYVPQQDLYIEKDTEINEEIERLRLAATTALMSRKDVIIVASVSAIYGLGSPEAYGRGVIHLEVGRIYRRKALLRQLVESQYQRNDYELRPGTFRVRGDTLEVAPAYLERTVYRITFFGDEVERILEYDPVTGERRAAHLSLQIFPAKHYLTEEEKLQKAIADIEAELAERVAWFEAQGKVLEAQRLLQRTRYDL